MDRYAAFLRGMNLGGRRIKNEELRAHFAALGCAEVATFRASGNVVFAADGEKPAALGARLEAGLGELLGYEVPVFLRDAKQLLAISVAEPFGAEAVESSAGKLQIALLRKAPSSATRRKVAALSSDADRLAIGGRELYWLPRGRMSDSELDLDALGAILGLNTIRTKGTIEQIAARHFAS
jgi:uncharacterized protein (DUF1697 family)